MDSLAERLASSLTFSKAPSFSIKIKFENRDETFRCSRASKIYLSVQDMKRHKLTAFTYVVVNDLLIFRCWPDLSAKEGSATLFRSSAMSNCEDERIIKFFHASEVSCKVLDASFVNNLPAALNVICSVSFDTSKDQFSSDEANIKALRMFVTETLKEESLVCTGASYDMSYGGFGAFVVCIDCVNDSSENFCYFKQSENTKFRVKVSASGDIDSENSLSKNSPFEVPIGGLKDKVEQILEFIDFQEKIPPSLQVLAQSIGVPKGILLFGPPGTGKTLLVRHVAKISGRALFCVNGPEIVGKFFGETEIRLREVFERAAQTPKSLIFIDEMDSLAPKREESTSGMERRVVATLLTLMDGISGKEGSSCSSKIFVIGATNRPHALDPALRRPGRFDREVEIGIPTVQQRYEILVALLQKSQTQQTDFPSEELMKIAACAHGYVGADLASLCREATLRFLQRTAAKSTNASALETQIANSSDLSFDDLTHALTVVKPSAMKEICVEIPHIRWSDIGGQEETKSRLKESVEWPLVHPEAFARMNIKPPKGILLYGPPGCSKTLMAKALATEAKLNFIPIKGPELFNKWVGESERAVKEVFRKARAASPSIIFFDEIDAIGTKRSEGAENTVQDRVLSVLLNEMDGIEALVNVTIVGATNRPDIMVRILFEFWLISQDPALLRPGRFDRLIYIAPPDYDARLEIFKIHARKMPFSPEVLLNVLASRTEGYSGAEVAAICQEAGLAALNRDLSTEFIVMQDFEYALKKVRKAITTEMLEFYENYSKAQ